MTFTEDYKLLREYVRNRTLITNAMVENKNMADEGVKELKI
jgi:hypothetical protein